MRVFGAVSLRRLCAKIIGSVRISHKVNEQTATCIKGANTASKQYINHLGHEKE